MRLWAGLLVLFAAIFAVGWLADSYLTPGFDSDTALRLVAGLTVLVLPLSALIARRGAHDTWSAWARFALLWGALFAVLIVGYAYRSELGSVFSRLAGTISPQQAVEKGPGETVVSRSLGGHFQAIGYVNDQKVLFMIDTGASDVVLTPNDARQAGLEPSELIYDRRYRTANGITHAAPVILRSVRIGNIELRNVRAAVAQDGLDDALLGLSFLNRLAGYEVSGDRLILKE